jgi:purine-cytosine permease-like protein
VRHRVPGCQPGDHQEFRGFIGNLSYATPPTAGILIAEYFVVQRMSSGIHSCLIGFVAYRGLGPAAMKAWNAPIVQPATG